MPLFVIVKSTQILRHGKSLLWMPCYKRDCGHIIFRLDLNDFLFVNSFIPLYSNCLWCCHLSPSIFKSFVIREFKPFLEKEVAYPDQGNARDHIVFIIDANSAWFVLGGAVHWWSVYLVVVFSKDDRVAKNAFDSCFLLAFAVNQWLW